MKKLLRRALAMTLVVILLCVSIVMPQNSGLGLGMAQNVSAVAGTAIAKAAGTYLLQRSYAEISAYAIANDVPVLGGVAKLMLTPEQRANMKQRAQVEQILESVTAIERSVANMEAQISTINLRLNTLSKEIAELQAAVEHMEWQVIALNQKISQQEAAIALNSSVQSVQAIAGKYKAAWKSYETMVETAQKLAGLQAELETTTDTLKRTELEEKIKAANSASDLACNAFINIMNEGGGFAFASDIGDLQNRMWNADNPTASYLGAYEAYLRQNTPFEHQIIGPLQLAMQSCTDTMTQILTLYTEYYTCMRTKYPDDARYKNYTDAYFKAFHEQLLQSVEEMANSTGFAEYMIPAPLAEEELKAIQEVDPTFPVPECIDSSVTVNGKSYPCYKVRSNSDGQYYLILKSYFPKDQLVQSVSVNYVSTGTNKIYRPVGSLDHQYTDDGQYRLISNEERPYFVTTAYVGLVSHLRLEGGLTALPQEESYFLLRNSSADVYDAGTIWQMQVLDGGQMGTAGAASFSSKAVHEGTAGTKMLAIYRAVATDDRYTDGQWKVLDKVQLEGREITVRDGQVLDLTGITVDLNNVTIRVLGSGTIVSNPKIRLKNSAVYICTDQPVTIKNLNITAKHLGLAAIQVTAKNANIRFEGTNSAAGNTNDSINKVELLTNFVPGNPIAASHGMYLPNTATVTVAGTAAFTGAGGGAGICVNGAVSFVGEGQNATLSATGSKRVVSGVYVDASPEAVGAGIGGSLSATVKTTTTTTSNGTTTKRTLDLGLSNHYIGSKAVISLSGLTVKASGVSSDYCKSDDIGGVTAGNKTYSVSAGGKISNCVVEAANSRISYNIAAKNDGNVFKPETYTINAYTHGSNGVTSKGISIRLYGSLGKSGWISLSDCGKDRGDWSGSFTTNSVGTLQKIEVKTNADNYWFPGKITVSAKFGGETITVYGGRWIGQAEKTLSPSDNIYCVTITTSNDTNAGTDANIGLFLQDNDGTKTDELDLSELSYNKNAFEKGDVESFYIYAPNDFGECRHAFLSSDHKNAAAGWKVSKIEIKKVQGGTDGYTVSPDYWYEYAATVNFGKYSGKTGAYKIEVQTGSNRGAGTNSNIRIKLHGNAHSKNTDYINMSDMAGSGDDFEKNDLDCFKIGFNINAIGDLQSITIDKDSSGVGADWYLSSIKITEIVADGQQAKEYTFDYNGWIYTDPVNIKVSSGTVIKTNTFIDPEILKGLEILEDGTYELTVDRSVTISEEILATLQETGKKLTVIMTNEEKPIYAVSFDGTQIVDYYSVTLPKGHGFADGNAKLTLLSGNPLPAGTTVRIYGENLGFLDTDKLVLWARDELGNWTEDGLLVNENGLIEIPLKDGKELLISKQGTDLPSVEKDPEAIPPTGDPLGHVFVLLIVAAAAALVIWAQKKRFVK